MSAHARYPRAIGAAKLACAVSVMTAVLLTLMVRMMLEDPPLRGVGRDVPVPAHQLLDPLPPAQPASPPKEPLTRMKASGGDDAPADAPGAAAR